MTRDEVRVGVVEFLNAKPLIDGLETLDGWSMHTAPPSALVGMLDRDEIDVGLCSSVDLLRAPFEPAWLPVGPLGSRGTTHTVRLFSRRPIEQIDRVHCDTDSHTSIALVRVLLRDHWKVDADVVSLCPGDAPEAVLLIGDKVVTPGHDASRWPVQLDLGQAWFEHTGLPFVFAVWMGRADRSDLLERAGRVIDRQWRRNRSRIDVIVARHAASHGWEEDEALAYLTDHIRFDFGPEEAAGLSAFLEAARGLDDRPIPAPLSC